MHRLCCNSLYIDPRRSDSGTAGLLAFKSKKLNWERQMKFVVPYKFEKDAVTGKPERKSSQDEAPDSPGSLLT